jgi:CRISPR-associated Csx10 family RAMP protein
MKQYRLLIRSEQPLMLGDRVSFTGNVLESDKFIPGATLRGAFAYEMLQEINPDKDPWFQAAFVAGKLSFGDAHPIAPQHVDALEHFGPTPFTALSCKRFSGLKPKGGEPHDHHGVFDSLVFQAPNCPTCDNRLKRFSTMLSKGGGTWAKADLETMNYTRTALDDRVGSVSAHKLYTLECLDRGNYFAANVKVLDELNSKPIEALTSSRWWVGNNRTRGLGKIKILAVEPVQMDLDRLEQRLDRFQKRVPGTASKRDDEHFFSVDLQTPAQALDAFLNPVLSFSSQDFAVYFPGVETLEIVSQAVRHVRRGGWNALLNMPKPTLPMQAAGSVFLLKAKGPKRQVLAGLMRLQQFGMGENFAEGFGHVAICHPFHSDPQTTQGAEP